MVQQIVLRLLLCPMKIIRVVSLTLRGITGGYPNEWSKKITKTKMNLNQITIPSLDLEKSIPFYKTLGLKPIVEAMPHYARFVCPDGNSTFSIHLVEALPKGPGTVVYFECNHLDEEVENLIAKGIQFEELPKDQPWLWREARLKDPDGNQLILYYGGENRLNPPWRVES